MTHAEHTTAWELLRALEGDSPICMKVQPSGRKYAKRSLQVYLACRRGQNMHGWRTALLQGLCTSFMYLHDLRVAS